MTKCYQCGKTRECHGAAPRCEQCHLRTPRVVAHLHDEWVVEVPSDAQVDVVARVFNNLSLKLFPWCPVPFRVTEPLISKQKRFLSHAPDCSCTSCWRLENGLPL